jgi:NhaP-type Na+/H+ or K+/H+ antiporter
MMLLLVCFGAAMAGGAIFNALSWEAVATGLIILLIIRPLAGIIGLTGTRPRRGEKWVIAFFGIRGLGSFYYVAYALGAATFQQTEIIPHSPDDMGILSALATIMV